MPDLQADVIVVGGGVTGCATAAALADGRRRILVLEARKGHKPRFAGELIHPTGTQVLDDLGFMPELRAQGGVDVQGFAVVKKKSEPATLLPYREIPRTRPTGFAMDHRDLVEAMRAHLATLPGVELFFGQKVEELLMDGASRVCGVRTIDGIFNSHIVFGCDGRHSKVRPLLALAEQARLLSFTVAVRFQGGAAHLPEPGFGHIFLGAWGPMLIYPISATDARGCFDVSADLSGGPAGAAALLEREYAQHLPEGLRRALRSSLQAERPQIAANESIRTERSVARGAAIVGDAGGCSHPLTATGMTIGFTDALRLGCLLKEVPLADHGKVDQALRRYEIERYRFVRAREILADALYEVFRAAEPGTRAIRQGIFRYWQGSQRARSRSMALLSGADSGLGSFLKEYLTVVRTSTGAALAGDAGWDLARMDTSERMRALWGLGRKSLEKLRMVVRDVGREAIR